MQTARTLLIIAHSPSKNTQALANAVRKGANEALKSVDKQALSLEVMVKTPQQVNSKDILLADAVILGTTENLGYMAGLTKDMFDRCYYDWLDKKQGMPYAIYIRAGYDGTGTQQALSTINNGLRWNMVQEPLVLKGDWKEEFTKQVYELGMAVVVGMDLGIF